MVNERTGQSGGRQKGTALRIARSVVNWSAAVFIVSLAGFVFTLYPSPRQPDQMHVHREFTRFHSVRYLSNGQDLVVRVSLYAFWASVATMIVAGVIIRVLKARTGEGPSQ